MVHKRHSRRNSKGGSYTSASSYGEYVNGSQNAQFDRVFSTSGPYAGLQGNISIGAQGQNSHYVGSPNAQQLALVQKAGRRRSRGISRGRTRGKSGGIWGSVINQAIVPFSLLGMQQSYKRKRHGGKHTRKHRRH
jgi:hypothetical protein